MADSIQSRPHTCSRSRILSTESVAVDDDDSSHSHSASGHPPEAFESSTDKHPPGAFESSIVKTPSQFEAGLNTAPDTLDEAGSLDENNGHSGVYCSAKAISDQQMKHLKMILEMDKGKQRNVNNHSVITSTATTATTHNLKVLLNAACKAAAVIPSATPGLLTAAHKETAAIPDSSIDNLFIDEEIRPECPLFLIPTNNWWIDYDISARIPTLLVQNTLNSPEPTVESDDPPTSTRDITIVGESTVGESSVRDSLEDLPTDPEIAALPIPKNLTRAKASMEWKYYYKACVKEVNCLKYTRWKEIMKMKE
ncbi:uncharacterized protein BDCG_17323 [Blastomyces dermatitidis ER-3]|uniref:Uncharacterized protein n=1 Tax=Ajellomyces dermatitidis (strain ER-3 / ATCC MYA-2586) TaxID=559297 RepID=A0ABX2VXV8_AJEDR|nr:uncharacterized protein BDCG_17323 [Blastomyces dermatitidis ER-3]OAT01980.1 hypothetical protein BDCG_17323 [Blastomyces dermatitidis ER-3]